MAGKKQEQIKEIKQKYSKEELTNLLKLPKNASWKKIESKLNTKEINELLTTKQKTRIQVKPTPWTGVTTLFIMLTIISLLTGGFQALQTQGPTGMITAGTEQNNTINTQQEIQTINAEMIIINDESCTECYNVSINELILQAYGFNITKTELDYSEAEEIITKYNITKIPTFLVSPEANDNQALIQVWSEVGTIEEDGYLVFRSPEVFSADGGYQIIMDNSSLQYIDPNIVNMSIDDDPMKGNPNANITIIVLSDYQCPYSALMEETIKQVMNNYSEQVKIVFRDLPIDQLHFNARIIAQASECADEQGIYWDYHDALFNNQTELSLNNLYNESVTEGVNFTQMETEQALELLNNKTIEKLKQIAFQTGINQTEFNYCLDNQIMTDEVQKDIDDAVNAGLQLATPQCIINNRLYRGYLTYEEIEEIIKELN